MLCGAANEASEKFTHKSVYVANRTIFLFQAILLSGSLLSLLGYCFARNFLAVTASYMIFFGYFYLILPKFTALRVSSADFHYTLHNCNLFAPNNIDNALALLGEPFTTGPAVISEQYKFPHNRQTKSGSSLADREPKFCTG